MNRLMNSTSRITFAAAKDTGTPAPAAPAPAADDAAPEGETKAAAFKRIAQKRATNVLQAIKTMEGLASVQNYEYTDEQWAKIFGAIGTQLSKLQAKVAARGKVEAESLLEL